jgi:cysteinyl-tRNA synthetase
MPLLIHNTLTRRTEPFAPIEPGVVRMYVCGMTVYDYCHLGHARTFVAFDLITRWLRARGLRVTYVRNITDIDDKIIRRAAENNESVTALTARFIEAMQQDFAALGIAPPDEEPRATQFIPQMLGLIELLQKDDYAYLTDDGDVNFAVRRFAGYGKLSGKSLDDLRAGERVAVDAAKRDPLDFVLWKRAKVGEPNWQSPWGAGRPGWHIECSAMAAARLGHTFDIHGGGPDLVFPHHENEIAQSEAGFKQPFANVWIHSGALRVGEDKMSKSLGNFLTIREALKKYDAEVLRFFLVRSHYRGQIAFTESLLADARAALTRLYTALRDTPAESADVDAVDWDEPYAQRFAAAMDDDFNSALATSVLFELASELNRTRATLLARQLRALGRVLGLLQRPAIEFLQGGAFAAIDVSLQAESATVGATLIDGPESIQRLIDLRTAAKKARNFPEADRIRAQLLAHGIVLEDSAAGTIWRRQ